MSATDERIILVTAFMPFGGDELNPTELVLSALHEEICGFKLDKLLLPVEFGRAARLAAEEYDRVSPAAVIMLGQAGGRSAITPEAVGVNRMDARIPDNAGFEPKDVPITEGGEEELFSTLPIGAMIDGLRAKGIPAEVSGSAGLYVCNSLLYGMLEHNGGEVPTGFIHVPFIREQVEGFPGREDKPFMELADIAEGVKTAIEAVAEML